MYTIVDVGSNTIRMNVYDIRDDKLRLLFTKKATAGLASYVKDKRMSAAGIDRVVIRMTESEYRTIPVSDWIENDDSIFLL